MKSDELSDFRFFISRTDFRLPCLFGPPAATVGCELVEAFEACGSGSGDSGEKSQTAGGSAFSVLFKSSSHEVMNPIAPGVRKLPS